MKEVVVSRIKIDENNSEQIIVLKEVDGNRFLPVAIGMAEIAAIKLKLRGLQPPRPMTHDLLYDVIKGLNAGVKKVIIDRIDGSTFYAKVVLIREDNEEIMIDARPSDSIALALRSDAPIYIEDNVLNEAGISI